MDKLFEYKPFLYTFRIILFLLVLFSSCSRQLKHPNIVLIMADDLGYECLTCNGGESYQTRELDKLAATGIRYTNCFSQPLCTPSRVEIMTGKYNNRNYTAFGILKPGELTFGHLFKKAGYSTGIAGKWQLFGSTSAKELKGTGTFPTDAGFDEYCLWQIDKVGSRYSDPVIHWNSEEAKVYEGEYGPDIFIRFIDEFLEKHANEPFFLYYPMVLPHAPHVPTPDSKEWKSEPHKKNDRFFADMVRYMDKNVGKVVDKLDELGLRENTILIFTGDNGTNRRIVSMMNGEEIPGKKGIPVYYGTHVPLIINGGMVAGGQVKDNLIDFSDFLPTLCSIAGIDVAGWSGDGKSFERSLKKKKDLRSWVYCYYNSGKKQFPLAVFAQNKIYKLYHDGRFFNIEKDPAEKEMLDTINLTTSEIENLNNLHKVIIGHK